MTSGKLAQLMNLYKWDVPGGGGYGAAVRAGVAAFLPYLIKGGEGIEHITLIYMIYVLSSASSYLLNYKADLSGLSEEISPGRMELWCARCICERLCRSRCCC